VEAESLRFLDTHGASFFLLFVLLLEREKKEIVLCEQGQSDD
jgi:hypothetical protein